MRITGSTLCAFLAALLASGCGRPSAPPPAAPAAVDPAQFDGRSALREVAGLVAPGPRDAGTPGAERAALHLRDRLQALGVAAEIDAFEDDVPGGRATFRNVIGRIPGRGGALVLVLSHYDTKSGLGPEFQGANDGGSSTGILLELARVLAAGPKPEVEIRFAFLDGEECRVAYGPHDGLHGSRHLALQLQKSGRARDVLGVILLDMVGDKTLSVAVPRNGAPALISAVFDAARDENARPRFSLGEGMVLDDHQPFLEAGMPAVDLIDFDYGSAPGRNDYWHTPADRMENICAESLQTVGRVTLRMIGRLAAER